MFEYIKGTLIEITPLNAVVDVKGIGYLLYIPLSSFSNSPPIGEEVLFYISPVIRENFYRNFAFLSREERDLFEKISEVSGIGPKTALALIGHLDKSDLEAAITSANVTLLSKIPGIGKKTAERLIVEMRDKILKGLKKSPLPSSTRSVKPEDRVVNDALSALINLGYNSLHAQQAIKKALTHYESPPPLGDLIKMALSGI
ncbi:MAG: Holliday junction ATP-dependent DNA helicase RuvA [Chlamydiae bacterium]|nr:Holliday junction ATP-dependent DNA helicase RuvA [Chlamydiota bacterium]